MPAPIASTGTPIPRLTFAQINDAQPLTGEQLAGLAFFAGLDPAELAAIARHSKISRFDAGETILQQGDLANRFYILLTGRAVIELKTCGHTIAVEELEPGAAVGFSWLLTPEQLHFTARALEPVTAVFFYGTLLREDCELDPRLAGHLFERAAQTLLRRLEAAIALLAKNYVAPGTETVLNRRQNELPSTPSNA